MREQVLNLIERHSQQQGFAMDVPLVQLGIDSMKLIQVILDIETELGLIAPDQYMTEEWFRSPETVVRLFEEVARLKE